MLANKLEIDPTDGVFQNENPLSTFHSKIKMGRIIKLYGKETESILQIFRNIRNTFAHSHRPITLGSPGIMAALQSINHKVFVAHEPIQNNSDANECFNAKLMTIQAALFLEYLFSTKTASGILMKEFVQTDFPGKTAAVSASVTRLLELHRPLP
jgi:hypothetical protein